MDSPYSFNMGILSISWPWDLFGSRFLIIFSMSFISKVIKDKDSQTAQLHSAKSELRSCADLNLWSRVEIRQNAFRRSAIPQKQFITSSSSSNELFSKAIPGSHCLTLKGQNKKRRNKTRRKKEIEKVNLLFLADRRQFWITLRKTYKIFFRMWCIQKGAYFN